MRQAEAAKEMKRKLNRAERQVKELDMFLKKVYESYAPGKMPEKRYKRLSSEYEQEQAELEPPSKKGRRRSRPLTRMRTRPTSFPLWRKSTRISQC